MSTEKKIVTHEDLDTIKVIEDAVGQHGPGMATMAARALVARLRSAAEADAPPLPEGWYSWRTDSIGNVHVWHDGNDRLWLYDSCQELFGYVTQHRDRLTPLRPTVTEADVEKAAEAARHSWADVGFSWVDALRAAFRGAGIEVQGPE